MMQALRASGRPSLAAVFAGLAQTISRFPGPLLCALAWTATSVLMNHDYELRRDESLAQQLQLVFFLGFFGTLAVKLWVERKAYGMAPYVGLSAAVLALLAARVLADPGAAFFDDGSALLFLAPGLVLLVAVAPFLAAETDNTAFWDFNRACWLGAAFAVLVALILAAGLTAAFAAIDELLGIQMPNRLVQDTWTVCFGLVLPWQALSSIPRQFSAPGEDYCPKWVRFLASAILVPLVLVYLAILYAYMAKVLVQWQLPEGQVGYLVSVYASFGVVTHLLAYPLRESGNRLVRLFHRHFYHLLFAPVALLAVAVGIRIADYGVTEKRYALVLFALWLGAMAVVFTLRIGRRLFVVPMTLGLLLVAASFGPWGATGLSVRSQLAQLERLLADHGLLSGGRIVASEQAMELEDAKRVSSIVAFLNERGSLAALRPWFGDGGPEFSQDLDSEQVVQAMGLDFVNEWENHPSFAYNVVQDTVMQVDGFEVLSREQLSHDTSRVVEAQGSGRAYTVSFDKDKGSLEVSDPAGASLVFDLGALGARLHRTPQVTNDEQLRPLMTLEKTAGGFRARVYVESLNGEIREAGPTVTWGTATVLLGTRGP